MTDTEIANARYYAISSIGWGRATTPAQAIENYVTQNGGQWKSTIYKTRKQWETSLRVGDARATLFIAPEGATGFYLDGAVHWMFEGEGGTTYADVKEGERLDRDPVTIVDVLKRLDQFEAKVSTDEVKRDLELTCLRCGHIVCDVEGGDTLDVLARVALAHVAGDDNLTCTPEEN
jgi:hypothetical protein